MGSKSKSTSARQDRSEAALELTIPRPKPCNNCKERHVKCDRDALICSQCKNDGVSCIRSRPKAKFKVGSSKRYDTEFPKNQTWISTRRKIGYVDETDNLKVYYAHDDPNDFSGSEADEDLPTQELQEEEEMPSIEDVSGMNAINVEEHLPLVDTSVTTQHASVSSYSHHGPSNDVTLADDHVVPTISTNSAITYGDYSILGRSTRKTSDNEQPPTKRLRPNSFVASASNYSVHSSHSGGSPTLIRTTSNRPSSGRPSPYKLSDVIRPPESWDDSVSNIVEAMLLRYFIEALSRWFDLNDPAKYFRITVPQRARTCQPLMNAVLTASARHLTRVKRYRGTNGVIRYDDRDLHGLTTATALHYHNECIKDLISSSAGLNSMGTEDFLAAAIILRFYEEVDAPLRDEERDSELFRQMAMAFFKTRPDVSSPDFPTTSPALTTHSMAGEIFGQSPTMGIASTTGANNQTPRSTTSDQAMGVIDRPHQAPYWVALRQEIHHSFINQRAFLIPLPKASIYRSFGPASDEIWSKRLVVFCADTIDYCYGTTNMNDPRWFELKQIEEKFSMTLPPTFAPIYYAEPDRSRHQVFPEIWYLDDWHTIGVQHIELARILLAVNNPTRPKLGRGHVASTKSMNEELKVIVLRLCGIAVGASKMPPSLVTAYTGIATCGELFDDPLEQKALMAFLDELDEVHAWPCTETRKALAEAWDWQEA